MQCNIILDTNVLLHDPKAIFSFEGAKVVIPIEVIEEIDSFKREMTELGRNSRAVAHILDELRQTGKLGEGIPLENESMLQVICDPRHFQSGPRGRDNRAENRILSIALQLQGENPTVPTVVVTKNVNLRLKADAIGLTAQDYDVDRLSLIHI